MKWLNLSLTFFLLMLMSAQATADKPPAPKNVSATDGTSPDQVTVTWSAVAGAPIYRVHRCTTSAIDSCSRISYQTGFTFNDKGGGPDRVYYYRVRACVYNSPCSALSEADTGYRGFVVSAGQSGSWFDPSHNGEGFFLQVLSDTEATVFWFTYDNSGSQIWMSGLGSIEGSKIVFPELISPSGGKFGPDFDPSEVSRSVWGSLKFDFSGCNEAVVKYKGPKEFGDGKLNAVRLTSLWGLGCDGEHSPNVSTGNGFLNAGFSGSWYDIDHDGEGFAIEVLNESTAHIAWFTYDTQGNPTWISALGGIVGTSIFVDDFQITSGAIFGKDFNPEDVVREHWGLAAFNFTSCGDDGVAGNMLYIPPPEFGPESGQSLYRLTSISGVKCDFLTSEYNVSGTMDVAQNVFIDSDVNDPNTPEVSNDLKTQPQILAAPAKLVGYATELPTGVDGDRFANESDEWDFFQLALPNGQTVMLDVSDWNANDPSANDIDLYLFDLDDPDVVIDSSENATKTEWVSAPSAGVYLVGVHSLSGTSKYTLKSGQSSPVGLSKLSSSATIAAGELMAAIQPQNNLMSVSDQKSYNSRIEKIEKENALTRVRENSDGEVLYKVDTARVDQLVPHPLTVKGWGNIKPENWQVVRAAKELSVNEDYRWSGPNYIAKVTAVPNDEFYGLQWHYPIINLPQAWNVTTGSEEVVVAVIDSGVYDHPDLLSNVDYSLGYDFVSNPLNSGDGDGLDPDARDPGRLFPESYPYTSHGTHVAGTVGATSNNGTGVAGVNWDVSIMPVRVLGNARILGEEINGTGTCWDTSQGMRWAGGLANESGTLPARTADIINMSLGFSSYCDGQQEIIDQLTSNDIIVIAAAGNDTTSDPAYPAALNNVISVSATTTSDELAQYSNFGSTIDIAAPGGDGYGDENDVLSTVMLIEQGTSELKVGFEFMPGTSMASPHVAGVAALMKSVYPEMGSNEFFTAVSSGEIAKDLANNGPTNKDDQFGYGRIDAQKAVSWAVEHGAQPIPPYLTSSISYADFGSTQLSISFEIKKGGTGEVSVIGTETSDFWMQLVAVDTDDDGLGTYSINVDRTALVDGEYKGSAAINASDGSQVLISVAMQVGEKVAGEAGYQYATLIRLTDALALEVVAKWEGLAIDKQYSISFSSVPFGSYFLVVGSDIDHDSVPCLSDELELDEGEFCQVFPLNSSPGLIIVYDQDIDLGLFTLRFPEGLGASSVSSLSSTEAQK